MNVADTADTSYICTWPKKDTIVRIFVTGFLNFLVPEQEPFTFEHKYAHPHTSVTVLGQKVTLFFVLENNQC